MSTSTPEAASGARPEGERRKLLWKRAIHIMLIVVPIGVLGNVVFTLLATDREVLAALTEFPRHYLLLALVLAFVPWVTHTLRLAIWTRFIGHALTLRESFTVVVGTTLGGAASPTALGGGVFKWGLLMQRGVSPGAAASVTTLASVEDAIFFAIAIPAAIMVTGAWRMPLLRGIGEQIQANLPAALILVAVVVVLTWITLRILRLRGPAKKDPFEEAPFHIRIWRRLRAAWWDARDVYEGIIRNGKGWFALSMCLAAIQWISRYSVIAALAAFLGARVDVVLFFLLQWVVFSLMTMIPTPGATGGAEASFFFVFGPLLPGEIIGIATAGWRFLTFYAQLTVGSVLFLFLYRRFRAAR